MVPLIQNRFLSICVMISGILLAISGVGFAIFGAYAVYEGPSLTYMINGRMVSVGEFAEVTLAIGLALVFVGFVLRYVYHKKKPARAE
jgi:multidrug transporter EmrE-like cation transporter